MFTVAPEDLPKIHSKLCTVVKALSSGMQRVDQLVDIGDGIMPIKVTGYWMNDIMRIDIKLRKD